MSEQNKDVTKSKKKLELIIVIIVALTVVLIASIYTISYFNQESEREELEAQQFEVNKKEGEAFSNKSDDKRENLNPEIAGNYMLMGETDMTDPSKAYSVMRLLPDGTVTANAYDGSVSNGWWHSMKKDGTDGDGKEYVATWFPTDENPTVYVVWKNSLIEWSSVYFGDVEYAPSFNTVFVSSSDTGTMVIDISDDGSAHAEFEDTNEESENKGLKYVYSGDYTVDNEYITITLAGATTRFLMFDYGEEISTPPSGIAPVFYERME